MKHAQYCSIPLLVLVYCAISSGEEDQFAFAGSFKGRVEVSNGTKYVSFRNIPYAKSPTGSRRFRLPEINELSIKTFDATAKEQIICPQLDEVQGVIGQEDCLLLNVFVPEKQLMDSRSALLPVLVFLHGPDFRSGSSILPEKLMDSANLVVVTVNYRLGPLGFLSLEDEVVPGNLGLQDQLLALKFVHNLIDKFGGDANELTLGGVGAGATSALLHMLSPRSKGLFKRIIAHAGRLMDTSTIELFTHESGSHYARALADGVDCDINGDSYQLLLCLQSKGIEEILEASRTYEDLPGFPNPWQPLVDNFTQDWVIPLAPQELVASTAFNGEALLLGADQLQAEKEIKAVLDDVSAFSELQRDFEKSAPVILFNKERDSVDEEDGATVQIIRTRYLDNLDNRSCANKEENKKEGNEENDEEDEDNDDRKEKKEEEIWGDNEKNAFIAMASDLLYHLPNYALAKALVKANRNRDKNIFRYILKSESESDPYSALTPIWARFVTSGLAPWRQYSRAESNVAMVQKSSVTITDTKDTEERLEFVRDTVRLMERVRNLDVESHPAVLAAQERRDKEMQEEWRMQERLSKLQREHSEDYEDENDDEKELDEDFEDVENDSEQFDYDDDNYDDGKDEL